MKQSCRVFPRVQVSQIKGVISFLSFLYLLFHVFLGIAMSTLLHEGLLRSEKNAGLSEWRGTHGSVQLELSASYLVFDLGVPILLNRK